MALENLYQCKEEDLQEIVESFVCLYENTPLYKSVFKSDIVRKRSVKEWLQVFLKYNAYYYAIFSESKEQQMYMIIKDSRKLKQQKKGKKLQSTLHIWHAFLKFIPISILIPIWKEQELFSSKWVQNFTKKEYFYILSCYIPYQKEEVHNQFLLIQELVEEARSMDMAIGVQVNSEKAVQFYQQFQFVLMKTIVDDEKDITTYCLLYRN